MELNSNRDFGNWNRVREYTHTKQAKVVSEAIMGDDQKTTAGTSSAPNAGRACCHEARIGPRHPDSNFRVFPPSKIKLQRELILPLRVDGGGDRAYGRITDGRVWQSEVGMIHQIE
jgi:hypothetical protein